MASITKKEAELFVSVCSVGPLNAAHFKAVADAIDTPAVIVPTFRLAEFFRQLHANGVLGEDDVDLLVAAVEAAASGSPISGVGDTAARTRAAMRKLKAVLPGSTVEGLVALIFT